MTDAVLAKQVKDNSDEISKIWDVLERREQNEQTERERRIHESYEMKEHIRQAVTEAFSPILETQRLHDERIRNVENQPKENSHRLVMWLLGTIGVLIVAFLRSMWNI